MTRNNGRDSICGWVEVVDTSHLVFAFLNAIFLFSLANEVAKLIHGCLINEFYVSIKLKTAQILHNSGSKHQLLSAKKLMLTQIHDELFNILIYLAIFFEVFDYFTPYFRK